MAPTLRRCAGRCPPRGPFFLGAARRKMPTPTLVTSCTALPPEGAVFSLGRPGGKVIPPRPPPGSVAHHHALAARVSAAQPHRRAVSLAARDGLQAAGHVHLAHLGTACPQGLDG